LVFNLNKSESLQQCLYKIFIEIRAKQKQHYRETFLTSLVTWHTEVKNATTNQRSGHPFWILKLLQKASTIPQGNISSHSGILACSSSVYHV